MAVSKWRCSDVSVARGQIAVFRLFAFPLGAT